MSNTAFFDFSVSKDTGTADNWTENRKRVLAGITMDDAKRDILALRNLNLSLQKTGMKQYTPDIGVGLGGPMGVAEMATPPPKTPTLPR
jgi:hypothetical protein